MVFETENIFIPKEALAFLMNDDINAIKELTEINIGAESVEFYCREYGNGNRRNTNERKVNI